MGLRHTMRVVQLMRTKEQEDNIRNWINALRSGMFAQTKGVLKDDKGFCCLGVACEIGLVEAGDCSSLPTDESMWQNMGLSRNPRVVLDGMPFFVSELNDLDYSFKEIADLLEETYL